ncbi:hypothetical protein [Pseudomonas sp. D(2018)]|uniref:hypothetical protein n=1 Tax=Pseudomonas sp. D(2018) TaxID=2502238 RepID=UPI00148507FC|nr:hypothetical protein [Pseudomonas sp. D(2018)]
MSHPPPARKTTSLARRLLFWVLLVSAFNALLAISVQLFVDYRRDLADLSDNLGFIRKSQSESLAAAAWNFDRPLVQVQLEGLVRSPWIAGAIVRYGPNEGAEVESGKISIDSDEMVEYPLDFDTGPRKVRVGRLYVVPNLDLVYQRTLDRGLVVAATQGVKTLIFSLALLLLIRHLVIRHLGRLADFVRDFQPGRSLVPVALARRPDEAEDELTELATALNQTYKRLNDFHEAEQRQRGTWKSRCSGAPGTWIRR